MRNILYEIADGTKLLIAQYRFLASADPRFITTIEKSGELFCDYGELIQA